VFDSKANVDHFAQSMPFEKVAANDYNLSVSSYVEAKDNREVVDIIRWANAGGTDFQYIDLTSVDRVTGTIGETATISADDAPSRAQQIVREGDVIFATTRPTQMRWAVIPAEFDGQIATALKWVDFRSKHQSSAMTR
jgi:type I restriction-modification system DNA methylase subunit